MGYYSSLMINCGQFSKGFKTSQKMTALFVVFNDAYVKQTL